MCIQCVFVCEHTIIVTTYSTTLPLNGYINYEFKDKLCLYKKPQPFLSDHGERNRVTHTRSPEKAHDRGHFPTLCPSERMRLGSVIYYLVILVLLIYNVALYIM